MDRSYFYEANKTGLEFFWFFYDFCEFCKISVFIEKMKEKKKGLHGLGPAHNEGSLTVRIWPKSEKEAHSNLDILH